MASSSTLHEPLNSRRGHMVLGRILETSHQTLSDGLYKSNLVFIRMAKLIVTEHFKTTMKV